MKKILYALMVAIASASMVACSDKDDMPAPNPNPNPLPDASEGDVEVTISTSEIETKAAMTEFTGNDKMNIFAKTYQRVDAPNIVEDVVATYDGNKWTMSPKVIINSAGQKNAFIYAVAPYDAAYKDAQNIPVDINKQVDLLYSGAYVPASITSPNIKLTMKHALSLLTFNIVPFNYSGSGTLKELEVSGDSIYVSGTMDASTGKIKRGDIGAFKGAFNKAIQDGGWKNDLPGLWSLPFNTRVGEVDIAITIDGKTYNLAMPEVEVRTGWQYIFRLVLTDNGLEFDPSQTQTISLNVDTDEAKDFTGYGRIEIVTAGSWFNIPTLFGDAVFGTIGMPKATQPYKEGSKADGLSKGDKVIVESWNSNGFKLNTLDNIDVVDLSAYE